MYRPAGSHGHRGIAVAYRNAGAIDHAATAAATAAVATPPTAAGHHQHVGAGGNRHIKRAAVGERVDDIAAGIGRRSPRIEPARVRVGDGSAGAGIAGREYYHNGRVIQYGRGGV